MRLDKHDTRPKRTVLRAHQLSPSLRRTAFQPPSHLLPFCSNAWSLSWSCQPGESIPLTVLPDACVIAIISSSEPAHFLGIVPGVFSINLNHTGFVYGLKFRPGAFPAFAPHLAAATLTGTRLPLDALLPNLPITLLAQQHNGEAIHTTLCTALSQHIPVEIPAPQRLAIAVAERIASDPSIVTVEQAASLAGLNLRSLQRLFQQYVGVGAKWMIRRCRLQEAAARIETGEAVSGDWADFALRLGYFDQSHFIRDFKRMTGSAPGRYASA